MKETQARIISGIVSVMKELEYTGVIESNQRSHFWLGNGVFWRLRERKKLARLRK